MPKIKLSSVTHKHGGEIEGEVPVDYIAAAANEHLKESVLYQLVLARLIMKTVGVSEENCSYAVDFEDEEEIFLVKKFNSERVDEVIRSLTKEEMEVFIPLLNGYTRAQKEELEKESWEDKPLSFG